MPYKSEAQRKYFHANAKKLAKQGVNIAEWDSASEGKKLPKRYLKQKIRLSLKGGRSNAAMSTLSYCTNDCIS